MGGVSARPRSSAVKALAAGALGLLLLGGGAGTFALWSDEETVDAGDITDGELALAVGGGTWFLGETEVDVATFRMVPGDTLTYEATVTPTIVGDTLRATLSSTVPGGGEHWTIAATLPDGGAELTEADSGVAVPIEVDVTLPVGSGNESQLAVLDLEDLVLSLEQVDPSEG
ncbi:MULTISPECIES: alternate-type signal peptide domain-containing protein [unclassified Serinicoccus]|uniref:alternate-type signal peptide domain-containing protein n=1 Tax=unclassified Serinicoccus TaxID=2643101 RepID=UPI0038529DAB